MADLLPRIRAWLERHGLLSADQLVLVAVSGGPDSLCLLHLLWRLQVAGGPRLHVAHLDHGLRPTSAAEAAQVAALASAWGLPATIERREVGLLAATSGEGTLAAARHARYAFLAATARASGAAAVAVAHQADDQAETVLLHLIHGAGPAGLRGMRELVPWAEWATALAAAPPAAPAPALIRPLLSTPRAAIEAYCAQQQLAPIDDPSNQAVRYVRTRIRQLLPALAAENPQIIAALGRTATICAEDYAYLQAQLTAHWPALASAGSGAVVFRRARWAELHPVLQRYALRHAVAQLGAAELSLAQIEAARSLAAHPGRRMRLGASLRLEVEQERLVIARLAATAPVVVPQLKDAELPLATPGMTPLDGDWVCVVQPAPPAASSPWWVALDATQLSGPLVLRRRRPGDRFRPAGGPGSRSLQDFFVDRKVPRALRAAWPILATPDAVVWVAGQRADARFLAGAQSQGTIWVGLIRQPGGRTQPPWDDAGAREGYMDHDIERVLISAEQLRARIEELGAQITADYRAAGDLLLVGVLKGCAMFMVDLARSIALPLAIDFIAVASYGASTESSGVVRLLKDLDTDIAGRHVLIVEDIIDSGLTLAYLRSQLLRRNPASLRICTLLNKPERRTADVPVDYLGFDIPNEFVVGYGLDYAERYRNLPYIGVLKPTIYGA